MRNKPEWMRKLVMPELPLRWYPRVTQYLELYKKEPRWRTSCAAGCGAWAPTGR
jgi:hypothetical protein